ncbi:MAG: hypothetical protein AB7O91_07020 [Sphingomonas sp.]
MRLIAFACAFFATSTVSAQPVEPPRVSPALEQLRHVVGTWDVVTEFLSPDGSVARAVNGSYEFDWVVPDHILRGVSRMPALQQVSAILFYLRPASREVEMVSVGPDGRLWVMTGADDTEIRMTPDVPAGDGRRMRLRFTRYAVTADRFESRMEISADGGVTWSPGNHQVFVRRR